MSAHSSFKGNHNDLGLFSLSSDVFVTLASNDISFKLGHLLVVEFMMSLFISLLQQDVENGDFEASALLVNVFQDHILCKSQ